LITHNAGILSPLGFYCCF